jgi:O-antigen/teichoic acid export membrane protein
MSVSTLNIFKNSSKFTGASILTKLIGFPISIVVAMVLSPTDYGYLGYVSVIISYASFLNLGILSAATREIPGLRKSNNLKKAYDLQNLAISYESVISFFVFVILIVISVFQKDSIIKTILIISSFTFIFQKFYNFLEGINFAFENFSLSAKGRFVRVIMYPILTLSLLFWLKIYSVPIVSLLIVVAIVIFFLKVRSYHLMIIFNKKEFYRLFKIGYIISIASVLYTLFTQVLDKTIIAAYLSKEELGLWVFSFSLVQILLGIFKDFASVLKPTIWAYASNVSDTKEGFFELRKISLYFSLLTSFVIGFVQLGFLILVNFITVKFLASQWVFLFLALYIFWEAIEKFPEIILYSENANKQNIVMIILIICLGINVSLDILAVKLGYGIVGIAIATTISQGISTTLMYIYTSRYLFSEKKKFVSYYLKILLPFSIPLLITIFHWLSLKSWGISLNVLIPVSIIIQISAWFFLIKMFYSHLSIISNIRTNLYPSIKQYFIK